MTTPTPGQHVRIRPGHPTGWGGAVGTVLAVIEGVAHVDLPHSDRPVVFALTAVTPGRFVDGEFVPDVPGEPGARDGSVA